MGLNGGERNDGPPVVCQVCQVWFGLDPVWAGQWFALADIREQDLNAVVTQLAV